ncbi:helix-turn-helix domain-containing protein [Pseudomonas sp. AK106]
MRPVRDFLAVRLKQLRLAKGMVQSELAELVGCEPNTISRYERAETLPSIEHLLRLSEVFGVSPMDILPPQSTNALSIIALRESLALKALELDDPEDLQRLISLASELAEKGRRP